LFQFILKDRRFGRGYLLWGALGLLVGLLGCCGLGALWLRTHTTHQSLLQRMAPPVYPGSALISDTTTGDQPGVSLWETRLYHTPDPLETVRMYMESRLGQAVPGNNPQMGRNYLFTLVDQEPLDFLRVWAPPGAPVQGITIELYASAPITPGTTIKVRSVITQP
jgi:hypothetical protein